MTSMTAAQVKQLIRDVPDFPKPGILFKDITPVLKHPQAMDSVIGFMAERAAGLGVTLVAGPEARGFLFGMPLAMRLGVGFVPIRKPGKLPWKTRNVSYALEYGTDMVQVHEDAAGKGDRVLLVDDLLATGGTMAACCQLMESLGAQVVGCQFMVELSFLDGRNRLAGRHLNALFAY
ncbi:MAG: adenine phosphoribosyltransferase [Planctomycetes bacterium]|nr:adenine phosphoribosyltransferase [Planctomycetota bacterium]